MKNNRVRAMVCTFVMALCPSLFAEDQRGQREGEAFLVPTFHCISIYWSPAEGSSERRVIVKYRRSGQKHWRTGQPLLYRPIDGPECKADYRGSLVNLTPGTAYDVALELEGTDRRVQCQGATWRERFPVESVVKVSDRDTTLSVTKSGRPDAYVVYDGSGCTIDTNNRDDVGIAVNASYIILRGFKIKNVTGHGIRLLAAHHVVIEDCDISKWGSRSEKNWGKDQQACVFSRSKDLRAVVVQRCKMHHPSWGSNSWAEKHGKSTHPQGPQAVAFWNSSGNHVIRFNECWSDKNHYFNDVMGAGSNIGHQGFPGPDSDIYGNYIANCWDDGIEAEGGGQNVRIWNNYIEHVYTPIGNAAVSIGPLYVWRNVSGTCYTPPGSTFEMTHGPFMKMGYAGDEKWMMGHLYIFNNTIYQEDNSGANGLGGAGRVIKHCTTRNNILHVRDGDRRSIAVSGRHTDNDFDFDLTSAGYPDRHQQRGSKGVPQYVQGSGFDATTRTGIFQLAFGSKGLDAGTVVPNFCESFNGTAPDMGAHESGQGKMRFGIAAEFLPSNSLPRR